MNVEPSMKTLLSSHCHYLRIAVRKVYPYCKKVLIMGVVCLCFNSCTNIEDASPAQRKTFLHFYEGVHNMYGVSAETTQEGFVILANQLIKSGNSESYNSIFIRTDKNGKRIADDIVFRNGISKSLKVADDGYYIVGDSIKTNNPSDNVGTSDLVVYSAKMYKIGLTGEIVNSIAMADRKDTVNITDIHGGAVTLNNQGNVIMLGTFKTASFGSTEKPFIIALNPSTFDTLWYKNYDIIDRDYINAKSIHTTLSGDLIWASYLLKENQDFSRSYLSLPVVKEQSVFINNDSFGETTDQWLAINDIQPAATPGMGFVIVGSYATPAGTGSNMFFVRADQNGNILRNSVRYFDAVLSVSNISINSDASSSEDTGDAIVATSDGGYVLAGSTKSETGGTGNDIFLMKVDFSGNPMWSKIIGGKGNETVNSIRETQDGGLLICGSNDLSGLSSVFVMKTDKNGELKD